MIVSGHNNSCWGTNQCLGTIMSGHKSNMYGHKRVWAQMCLGTNMCGHKCVWAQNVSGHQCVWAQTCVGPVVWAQSCMGTNVVEPLGLPFDYLQINWQLIVTLLSSIKLQ